MAEKSIMKTLKQLSIGDTIYQLCDQYDLGKPDRTQVKPILINSLSVDDKNGNLLINQVHPYSGGSYWSIVVKADKLHKSYYKFEPEQNTHRKGFFFINEQDANYIVKRAVIGKINSIEKSIPSYINKSKKEIEYLRVAFYEILNPSYYPEFKILAPYHIAL